MPLQRLPPVLVCCSPDNADWCFVWPASSTLLLTAGLLQVNYARYREHELRALWDWLQVRPAVLLLSGC